MRFGSKPDLHSLFRREPGFINVISLLSYAAVRSCQSEAKIAGSVVKCSSCTGDPSSSKHQSFEAAIGLQGQGYPLPGRGCEAQIWKEEVEHLEPVMACNPLSSADREFVEPCCVFCFSYKFAAHLLDKFLLQSSLRLQTSVTELAAT